jgi:hypothetical protein
VPPENTEPSIAEVLESTEERIRRLSVRLAGSGSRKPIEAAKEDPVDDLEGELHRYFARELAAQSTDQVRRRVIDGVVDKIMRAWEHSQEDGRIEDEIVERLIERFHERLSKATSGSRSRES